MNVSSTLILVYLIIICLRYESYVDSAYKDFLKNEGKAEALVDVDLQGALEMYIEAGQWVRALETAANHGPQLQHKYIAKYATSLIKVCDRISFFTII